MPSQPDPNSPYMESRVQAEFGVHPSGTPSMAGKPGPQAADLSFPAPPGVAQGQPSRPAAPQMPQPAAATAPVASPPKVAQPGQPAQPKQADAGAVPQQVPMSPSGVAGVASPLGVTSFDEASGEERLSLSPEGQQRYREAMVQAREKLGPVPRVFRDTSLPEMSVELGKYNYNPWTSTLLK